MALQICCRCERAWWELSPFIHPDTSFTKVALEGSDSGTWVLVRQEGAGGVMHSRISRGTEHLKSP